MGFWFWVWLWTVIVGLYMLVGAYREYTHLEKQFYAAVGSALRLVVLHDVAIRRWDEARRRADAAETSGDEWKL